MKWLVLAVFAAGCSTAHTNYNPRYVAGSELVLSFPANLTIHAGRRYLTEAPTFDGLAGYVGCVESAAIHAEKAESDGATGFGLKVAGGVFATAGLASLGGLAVADADTGLALGILGAGLASGLVGLVLASLGWDFENDAHGHAVDAVNYYNDERGSWGESCTE